MTWAIFNAILAGLVIAAYFLGRWVGRRSRDIQLVELRGQNQALKTMLDFTQSECEHVAGLLKDKIATAHAPVPPQRTDPITEWPLLREWAAIPDSMNKEVPYGAGHMKMQLVAQERYTAEMRKKIDDALGL